MHQKSPKDIQELTWLGWNSDPLGINCTRDQNLTLSKSEYANENETHKMLWDFSIGTAQPNQKTIACINIVTLWILPFHQATEQKWKKEKR